MDQESVWFRILNSDSGCRNTKKQCLPSSKRGTSLVVQWLRLCASDARGTGLIPGQGTKISRAIQCGQNNNNNLPKNKVLRGNNSILDFHIHRHTVKSVARVKQRFRDSRSHKIVPPMHPGKRAPSRQQSDPRKGKT